MNVPIGKIRQVKVPVAKLGLTKTDLFAAIASSFALSGVKALARQRGHVENKRMDQQAAITAGLASLTTSALVHLALENQTSR